MPTVESYHENLSRRLDAIEPGVSQALDRIETIDPARAIAVLAVLLGNACQATHATAITLGRKGIAALPRAWLDANLDRGVQAAGLNLNDDWDYRRLIEVVEILLPARMPGLLASGLASSNPDVREAAVDIKSESHRPIQWL